ncbi:morphogenetic protein associated with SpoVID [Evansella caseinilytica]|uniref:Morphogenetic protein associated with SpoVID n=1 Tax=Evansella caseinilytica TaxID=1503961 RepID=A0A1H3K5G8_9BACI|nr:SafA/ExsA family spore coat assembly protein [Evansella caseinilytica]SDY46995.1 morphogenetic protein associated with SpoVID [Evansella caseinilytica]
MRIHIVQKGDTLWKLAQKYGVEFEALKAANNHLNNPDLIMPGMKVKIPSGGVQAKKENVYQTGKKEAPITKEVPMKEAPPPSLKPEKEKPVPVPSAPKVPIAKPAPSYHLQKTDMNFNIYNKMEKEIKIPAPPKVPKPKEIPKVEVPPPVKKPMEPKPKPKPFPPKKFPVKQPLFADCYPVPPFYSGCFPCPPPYPVYHHQYPMPMPAPMIHGYPAMSPYAIPYPGQMPMQADDNMDDVAPDYQPDAAGYGDVTTQQIQPQQAMVPQTPMNMNFPSQSGYAGMPMPPGGYHPMATMPQMPHYAPHPYPALWRDEEDSEEEFD